MFLFDIQMNCFTQSEYYYFCSILLLQLCYQLMPSTFVLYSSFIFHLSYISHPKFSFTIFISFLFLVQWFIRSFVHLVNYFISFCWILYSFHWLEAFIWSRVKRPLLARVPSLTRFFNNLTEITCMKERVVEFFFSEAVNTVVWRGVVFEYTYKWWRGNLYTFHYSVAVQP